MRRLDKSGAFTADLIFIAIGAMDIGAGAIREIGIGDAGSVDMIDHIIHGASGDDDTGVRMTPTEDVGTGDAITGAMIIGDAVAVDAIIGINLIGGIDPICGSQGSIRQFDEMSGLIDDGRRR